MNADLSIGETIGKDSISITIEQADSLFLKNNFSLLAAKFEISATQALATQAKIYPNPNFFIDQGAYNHETGKWFDFSPTGQTAVSLQQMILLAGKRSKSFRVADINSKITALQFYDLIRTLRYQMHEAFYSTYFLNESIAVYDKEINSLRPLVTVYQAQYDKGNVSLSELARLQSLEFTLQNERLNLIHDLTERQSELILLTGDTLLRVIVPVMTDNPGSRLKNFNVTYTQLLDSAVLNRSDLKIAGENKSLAEANLSLQKAMGVPDVTLGANWDRQGSYITNYNSVSLAIDLPFWNRNQGNIRAAETRVSESKAGFELASLQIESDVQKAFEQYIQTRRLSDDVNPQFIDKYDRLLVNIVDNYRNHTISMLEFLDLFENYKDTKLQYNELLNKEIQAVENLNYVTGTIFFK